MVLGSQIDHSTIIYTLYHLICCSFTWLTPWMLGIAMVRQESWRTSVDNTNIFEVEEVDSCLSLLASDHELGCNWEKKDLPSYKYWGLASVLQAGS